MLLLTLSQQANSDASKRRDNHVWQLPQPPEDSGELVQGHLATQTLEIQSEYI